MLDLDDVLTYFAGERPDWWARVEAATPAEITTLESLHERPLPAVHRRWLERIGREPGELFDGYIGANPRVARLIEHFVAGGWRPQPPYSLFGRDPEGRACDIFLRELSPGEPDLVTFAMPGGPGNLAFETRERPGLLAPNLASFVFRAGFDNLIGKQYALLLRGRVRNPTGDHAAAIDRSLVETGLRREPGSDAFTASYRAQECAVQWLRNRLEGEDLVVRIWADDEALARTLGAVIGQRVHYEPGYLFPSAGPYLVHVEG